MSLLSRITLVCTAALWAANSLAIASEIQVTKLPHNAYLLTSIDYGTNIGLFITSKGAVLLDPMPGANNLDRLHATVVGLVGGMPPFIINTHQHEDHTGGNAYFLAKGAKLIDNASTFAEFQPQLQRQENQSHTAQDRVYFHQGSNSIFTGDIVDTSWHPTFYAGGIKGFIQSIDAILALGDPQSLIVPGHGKPITKAELRTFKANTLRWTARVRTLKNSGMSANDIMQDTEIKGILASFNTQQSATFVPEKAFIRFIERTLAVIDRDG